MVHPLLDLDLAAGGRSVPRYRRGRQSPAPYSTHADARWARGGARREGVWQDRPEPVARKGDLMYVRAARFEGIDPDQVDEQIADLRRQLDAGASGQLPDDAPPEAKVLMETVTRVVQLVDRKSGTFLGLVFCGSEDDLRRADEALNAMSPGEGGGRRTSVERYEVAIDQSFG